MTGKRLVCALRRIGPLLSVVLVTSAVALLAYGFHYAPVIYSDDWAQVVGQYTQGTLQWLDMSNRRPLLDAPLLVLYTVFGLNIKAFHSALIILHILASLQLYWLLRRLKINGRSFALCVSLLFLVYPADYTHMWLTMVGAWVVINLLFAYGHLLLLYVRRGSLWQLLAACFLLIASLGIYEAQLGVALAWPLLLLWLEKGSPRKRALFVAFGTGLAFMVWRTVGITTIGVTDLYLQQMQVNPFLLLKRVWLGLKVLAWSWALPLQHALKFESYWLAWGVLISIMAASWVITASLGRQLLSNSDSSASDERRKYPARSMFITALVGLAFSISGYVPYVIGFAPSLSSTDSRVNIFATIGVSLMIVSTTSTVSLLLAQQQTKLRDLTVGAILPLIALATITQAWVQQDSRVAWIEQKDIWQQLLVTCPSLREGTTVFLVLPGYEDRRGFANWRRTPLTAEWEVTSALRILYKQKYLQGDLFLPDADRVYPSWYGSPQFTTAGIVGSWSKILTPLNKAVFVSYEGMPRRLNVIENLQTTFGLTWNQNDYAPETRCLQEPLRNVELRQLVNAN